MRRFLISGGTRGLGLAFCTRYLEQGHRVFTFARSVTREAEALRERYPEQFMVSAADLTEDGAPARITRDAWEQLGGVDVLINNAAIGQDALLAHLSEQALAGIIHLNVTGTLLLTRQIVKRMILQGSGLILNVSSICGSKGYPTCTPLVTAPDCRCIRQPRRHWMDSRAAWRRKSDRTASASMPLHPASSAPTCRPCSQRSRSRPRAPHATARATDRGCGRARVRRSDRVGSHHRPDPRRRWRRIDRMSDVATPFSWPVMAQGEVIATVVIDRDGAADGDARSYTHDGYVARCVSAPGVQVAIDIESEDNPAALAMAQRFGMHVHDFLDYWTVLECRAKLSDVPVHALLKQHPPHARGDELVVLPGCERAVFSVQRWRVAVVWRRCPADG